MCKALSFVASMLFLAHSAHAGILGVYTDFHDWGQALYSNYYGGWWGSPETFDGDRLTHAYAGLSVAQNVPLHGDIVGGAWSDSLKDSDFTQWNLSDPGTWLDIAPSAWGATFDLKSYPISPSPLTYGPGLRVTLSSGDWAVIPGDTQGFWGIITVPGTRSNPGTRFTSVRLTAAGSGTQKYTMDNMVYNPEPGTAVLIALGLVGVIHAARRRTRSSASKAEANN